jgi:hypothetical protein
MDGKLSTLWQATAPEIASWTPLPAYLQRVLPPPPHAAVAVRLRMHGEIRLGTWKPFQAEEVIHRERGFVWKARVGTLITGQDSLVDGVGTASWKLLGLFPVLKAAGPDLDRSATGRWLAESLLLPTMLLPEYGARWQGSRVRLAKRGVTMELDLVHDDSGRLKEFRTQRWGNPAGGAFAPLPFGGVVEEERRFDEYTIPARLRVGWHIGTPRWSEGEFFRMTVDQAAFR